MGHVLGCNIGGCSSCLCFSKTICVCSTLWGIVLVCVFRRPNRFGQLCVVGFADIIERWFVAVISGFEFTICQTKGLGCWCYFGMVDDTFHSATPCKGHSAPFLQMHGFVDVLCLEPCYYGHLWCFWCSALNCSLHTEKS